jgi:hypothetical protein
MREAESSILGFMTSYPLAVLCCVLVPVLLALTCIRWAKATRRDLPHWRNGIVLASMVIISADWLFETAIWFVYSLNRESLRLSNAVEAQMNFDIYYGFVALPFAFFLKGAPRILLIVAWLVLQIFKRHFFIV